MELRQYQRETVASVEAAWARGARVCCVLPTGAGKTVIGCALGRRAGGRGLWLAHRIELLEQARDRLRAEGVDAGIYPDPWALVQVASLDTLVSRGEAPQADWVVFDEAQHAQASTYRRVLDAYATARVVGLTATPQRSDGRPLGDVFNELVVGATYSQLLELGHIVSCRVFRPDEYLGSDLAREPLDAWQRWGESRPTFAFARDVAAAEQYAAEFAASGVSSDVISQGTAPGARRDALERFRAGEVRVIWNVHCLTEGVDVPTASCVLLARGAGHAGTYLQMAGRIMRPCPGKADALLLDLPGVSHVHGVPTCDREYALDGRAIKAVGEPLRVCPQCGYTLPSALPSCDRCGYEFPRQARSLPRIWDLELAEAVEAVGGDPSALPTEHRRREWDRLCAQMSRRDWSIGFVRREYTQLFASPPPAEWVAGLGSGVQSRELARLRRVAAERGYKYGWVRHRFHAAFGKWP